MGLLAQHDAVSLIAKRNSNRRDSTVSFGREAKKSKLKRRFGTDDRTWTEKTKVWKNISLYGSFFCQFVFFAAASYLSYKVFYEPNLAGIVNTTAGCGFIAFLAYVQYLTSDGFWDRKARGEFNISFAFLNFVVIWGAVAAVCIGGTFLYGVDAKQDPQLTEHPAVAGIRAEIAANKEQIASLQAENSAISNAPKTDPSVYVQHGKDKGARRHNVQNEVTARTKSINEIQAANTELTKALATQYGVSAEIQKGDVAISQKVESAKIWFRIGMMLIMLICFEVARRFLSKWEEVYYAEQVMAGNIHDPEYRRALVAAQSGKAHVVGKA